MHAEQSEAAQAERMSRARKRAAEALGSSREAIIWLDRANPELGGRRPADVVVESQDGLESVLRVLGVTK